MSTSPPATENSEETQPIQLDVKVESPEQCLREVVVTIPRGEVERYLSKAYDELVPDAQVPGFRAGRAPRKLVEKQFRDRISEQVKGSLVMDSLSQVTESDQFYAISEPNFDFESITLPEDGDFIYQFTIEVRPDFDTPDWNGLALTRSVEDVDDAAVEGAMLRILDSHVTTEATDQPAALGDRLLITIEFKDGDKTIASMDEESVTLSNSLSFPDGSISDFGKVVVGITEGETRTATFSVSEGIDDEEMKGKELTAEVHAVEVFKKEMPELTSEILEELGDFESEDELRQFIVDTLKQQAEFRGLQGMRQQIIETLSGNTTKFELPPALVRRQTSREMERRVLELRSNGFADEQIRPYVNAMRQNMQATTEQSLREHFILEQIAEEQKIDADNEDYEAEIARIAAQSNTPIRRVRSRLEKSGQMDALRNQIVESKVIDLIIEKANVTEETVDSPNTELEEAAIDFSILNIPEPTDIPEAQYDDNTPKAEASQEKD
ncbi:MAG: trigger factor [Planctomycetota bacterium]